MENEIMNNELVMDEVAEVATVESKKGLAVAAVGVAVIVAIVCYKKLIKPAIAKRKAKKEKKEVVEAEFYEAPVVEEEEVQ